MRIAFATNFLYPEKMGGTELYCYQLAESLLKMGHTIFWIVPHFDTDTSVAYRDEAGIQVIRFAAVAPGNKPEASFVISSFIGELVSKNISVVHFHEFGGYEGVNPQMIDAVKNKGITSVVTLHLVHYICQAGTMRYGGKEICNGALIPNRCGSCNRFSESTSSRNLNHFITRFFNKGINLIESSGVKAPRSIHTKIAGFKKPLLFIDALKKADAVVSLTKWFHEVLLINGQPAEKIIYMPQVVPVHEERPVTPESRKGFVYIGRINKEKGIRLLLNAALRLKKLSPDVFIDVFGPVPEAPSAKAFLDEIRQMGNIHYKGVLDPKEVFTSILNYKAVLLPSLVAEMAPLIIMEANQARVPVIASDVPGSKELITEYNCGLLFRYNSADDLVKKITQVESGNPFFSFIQPVKRSYNDLAARYANLYSSLAPVAAN